MNKSLISIIVIVIIVGGYMLIANKADAPANGERGAGENVSVTATIVYENGAWNPPLITVKAGDAIKITNNHTSQIRAASAPHPIHTSQPDFDSDTLEPGESYIYTTKAPGTIGFHNHFNPGVLGEIVVQ